MKKLISSLLMAFVCVGAMAEQDTKEYKTFVKNDHHVFYCTHNGIHVVVDPTEGGIFEPNITVITPQGNLIILWFSLYVLFLLDSPT